MLNELFINSAGGSQAQCYERFLPLFPKSLLISLSWLAWGNTAKPLGSNPAVTSSCLGSYWPQQVFRQIPTSDDCEFVSREFFKTNHCRVDESFCWRSANTPVVQVLIFHMVTATVSAHVSLVGPRDPCNGVLHVYLSLCVCICTHTLIHAYIYILACCS